MWLWFFGIPFFGAVNPTFGGLLLFASPTLELFVSMVVVIAIMGFLGRRALNY
jgi:hypothetical protein